MAPLSNQGYFVQLCEIETYLLMWEKSFIWVWNLEKNCRNTHIFHTFSHIFVFFKICLHFCLFFSVLPVFVYIWKIDLVINSLEFEGFSGLTHYQFKFNANELNFLTESPISMFWNNSKYLLSLKLKMPQICRTATFTQQ